MKKVKKLFSILFLIKILILITLLNSLSSTTSTTSSTNKKSQEKTILNKNHYERAFRNLQNIKEKENDNLNDNKKTDLIETEEEELSKKENEIPSSTIEKQEKKEKEISKNKQKSKYNSCTNDRDCPEDYICQLESNTCTHKNFLPIHSKTFFSILLVSITSAVATSTGIGGGSVISTILLSIENFSPKEAVPISVIIILFCSLTTFFMGAKAKLDYNDFNFVDYDIILVCCPLVLFGAKMGTILNIALPNSFILIILTCLLIINCYRTYNNAKLFSQKENREGKNSLLVEYKLESFELNQPKNREMQIIDKKPTFKQEKLDNNEEDEEKNNKTKNRKSQNSFYSDKPENTEKNRTSDPNNNSYVNEDDIYTQSVYTTNVTYNKFNNSLKKSNTVLIPDYVSEGQNDFRFGKKKLSLEKMKSLNIQEKKKRKSLKRLDDFNLPSLIELRKRKSVMNSTQNINNPNQNKRVSEISFNPTKDNKNEEIPPKELNNNENFKDFQENDIDFLKIKDLPEEDFENDTIRQEEEALEELIHKIKEIELIKSDILYENSPIRLNRLRTIFEFICVLLLMELLLGNKNIDSIIGVKNCSFEFYIIILIFGGISYVASLLLFDKIKKEEEISDIFSSVLLTKEQFLQRSQQCSIIRITDSERKKLKLFSFLTGTIASTIGVGGGIIMCPLFIELGVNPKVAASSSNLLVIVSSLSSTLLYLFLGKIRMDYSLVFCSFSTISAIIGNYIINDYITRTKKISFLIYVLFYLMVFSLILVPLNALIILVDEAQNEGQMFKFNSLCQDLSN